MSGITIPKFLEGVDLPDSYYVTPNPYQSVESNHVDLLSMSRYARRHGKKLVDLTEEEVKLFIAK